MYIKLLEA